MWMGHLTSSFGDMRMWTHNKNIYKKYEISENMKNMKYEKTWNIRKYEIWENTSICKC